MKPNSSLTDFVKKYHVLSHSECDLIISEVETNVWNKHVWTSHTGSVVDSINPQTEFLRTGVTTEIQNLLNAYMNKTVTVYMDDIGKPNVWFQGFSHVQVNKYPTNTMMLPHCDHIKSLYVGDYRGIPALSIVGALNDDYEGGEFYLWDDYVIPLAKGDLLIFPSLFLYPHGVRLVTKNTRYSFVSWLS
jgi:hypothetical protein